MRLTILFITIYACILCFVPQTAVAWGPKFMLQFENEAGDYARVFVGIDSNATDGLDADIFFQFGDTAVKEVYDLPPTPGFYAYMIRDTLDWYNTHSYADVRSIPKDSKQFKHRYTARCYCPWLTETPQLTIKWNNLPAGIDSAKIGSIQNRGVNPVDMLANNQIMFEGTGNIGNIELYIDIWYNSDNFDTIRKNNLSFISPNPASGFITIHNIDVKKYHIYDILGNEIKAEENSSNYIEINKLYPGLYNLAIEQATGNIKHFPFIKN